MSSNKNQKPATNKIEQTVSSILSRLNLPFKEQVSVDKYTVDFLVDDKYIVECYGDFWHCNPQQYTSSYFNKGKRKTAEEIWQRDMERKKKFEEMGYKFLCLWESDIRKNPKIIKSKIKRYIKLDERL
jgi:very-short-patch-repair endonuclease